MEIASLFAEKGDYIEEQAEEVVSIPVGTYTGRYVKAASVDRERLMQSTGKAVSGTENWYYVSGHEDRQYLIQKLDGEYSLWKFQCFESSEYPYRDVLELVYRIDSAEAVRLGRSLTLVTDYGNEIDGLKYTAVSDMFYEYSGIAYNRLTAETADRVCRILHIEKETGITEEYITELQEKISAAMSSGELWK